MITSSCNYIIIIIITDPKHDYKWIIDFLKLFIFFSFPQVTSRSHGPYQADRP